MWLSLRSGEIASSEPPHLMVASPRIPQQQRSWLTLDNWLHQRRNSSRGQISGFQNWLQIMGRVSIDKDLD